MEQERSWEKITNMGNVIGEKWKVLAEKYQIPIRIYGLPAITNFEIKSNDWLKYKTFITQEMLKKRFLATNSIYVCIEHKKNMIDEYFENLDPIFKQIGECMNGKSIDKLLEGPICHSGFNRLN